MSNTRLVKAVLRIVQAATRVDGGEGLEKLSDEQVSELVDGLAECGVTGWDEAGTTLLDEGKKLYTAVTIAFNPTENGIELLTGAIVGPASNANKAHTNAAIVFDRRLAESGQDFAAVQTVMVFDGALPGAEGYEPHSALDIIAELVKKRDSGLKN